MDRNKLIFFSLVLLLGGNPFVANSQKKDSDQSKSEIEQRPFTTPKLVVGIVVDQMRYDYLTRFWDQYGEYGFKRLVRQGYNCKNNHFNYAPTSTAPGHASVYTGTSPASHGIIGNSWYDKEQEKDVYCVSDDTYSSVGSNSDAGKMSPFRMNVTTLTDQLRLHTQLRGKVISLSIKDRGAVIPGGHMANAAYWFAGGNEGNWITSTYYMDQLPKWVSKFNASRGVDQYRKPWSTLKDIDGYSESGSDNNMYEGVFSGEEAPVFPHDIPGLWNANGGYELIKATPYGNNLTTDFAIAAVKGEELGADGITDFLAISYSSTDYVGHKYGVNSKEIEDTYLRLDEDIENLLNFLDKQVGAGDYTLFLTSDHGVADVPAYLIDQKIPVGYFQSEVMLSKLREFLNYRFGTTELLKSVSNNQLYLDSKVIQNLDLTEREVQETIAAELLDNEFVDRVYTAYQMENTQYTTGIPYILQNGFNQKRSGDIIYVFKPGVTDFMKTGTTHGSPQIYDTHVPLLFYGKGISHGSIVSPTEIPDIAPTIAALLGIAFPNGATGKPVKAVLE